MRSYPPQYPRSSNPLNPSPSLFLFFLFLFLSSPPFSLICRGLLLFLLDFYSFLFFFFLVFLTPSLFFVLFLLFFLCVCVCVYIPYVVCVYPVRKGSRLATIFGLPPTPRRHHTCVALRTCYISFPKNMMRMHMSVLLPNSVQWTYPLNAAHVPSLNLPYYNNVLALTVLHLPTSCPCCLPCLFCTCVV